MDKLRQLLKNYIENQETIISATASNPRDQERIQKLRIRPVLKKEELIYQVERFVGTKVYHENLSPDALVELLVGVMEADFRQLELDTACHRLTVLVSKKGKATVREKTKTAQEQKFDLTHNRQKQYILPQHEPIPFLVALGVQTAEGRVVQANTTSFAKSTGIWNLCAISFPRCQRRGAHSKLLILGAASPT